jgi:hypothetical protein
MTSIVPLPWWEGSTRGSGWHSMQPIAPAIGPCTTCASCAPTEGAPVALFVPPWQCVHAPELAELDPAVGRAFPHADRAMTHASAKTAIAGR